MNMLSTVCLAEKKYARHYYITLRILRKRILLYLEWRSAHDGNMNVFLPLALRPCNTAPSVSEGIINPSEDTCKLIASAALRYDLVFLGEGRQYFTLLNLCEERMCNIRASPPSRRGSVRDYLYLAIQMQWCDAYIDKSVHNEIGFAC